MLFDRFTICFWTTDTLSSHLYYLLFYFHYRSVRRGTEDGNRQAPARAECRCKAHQRYPEIRPRTGTINPPGFTLA